MPLESPTDFIDQLNPANPIGNIDSLDEADNHLRAVKEAVQGSFPNLGLEAVTLTAAEINQLIIDIADNVLAIDLKKDKADFLRTGDRLDINNVPIP